MRLLPMAIRKGEVLCMRTGCLGDAAWVVHGRDGVLGRLCQACAERGPDFARGLLVQEAQSCLEVALADSGLKPSARRGQLRWAGILLYAAAEDVFGGPWQRA